MKTNSKKEEIFALKENDEGKTEACNPEEIWQIATKMYIDLWKNERNTQAPSVRKSKQLMAKIKNKVSKRNKIKGEEPISLEEFKTVTKLLLENKSPGADYTSWILPVIWLCARMAILNSKDIDREETTDKDNEYINCKTTVQTREILLSLACTD